MKKKQVLVRADDDTHVQPLSKFDMLQENTWLLCDRFSRNTFFSSIMLVLSLVDYSLITLHQMLSNFCKSRF
jgi:hypothetical protein